MPSCSSDEWGETSSPWATLFRIFFQVLIDVDLVNRLEPVLDGQAGFLNIT